MILFVRGKLAKSSLRRTDIGGSKEPHYNPDWYTGRARLAVTEKGF